MQQETKGEIHPLLSHIQAKQTLGKQDKTFMTLISSINVIEETSNHKYQDLFITKFKDSFINELHPRLPQLGLVIIT